MAGLDPPACVGRAGGEPPCRGTMRACGRCRLRQSRWSAGTRLHASSRISRSQLPSEGVVLVEALGVGICGTDHEIIAGEYGEAPPGGNAWSSAHESLGRVIEDPDRHHEPGDLVAGIVRHPDPVPCPNCAVGEWDMCRNGRYTEHGIKRYPAFARDRWRIEPAVRGRARPGAGRVGVLLEPTSVVAKAWDAHRAGSGTRAEWQPQTRPGDRGRADRAAGRAARPRQRGLTVHVLDRGRRVGRSRSSSPGSAPTYHSGAGQRPALRAGRRDQCTGAHTVVLDVMCKVAATRRGRPSSAVGDRSARDGVGAPRSRPVTSSALQRSIPELGRRHPSALALARRAGSWTEVAAVAVSHTPVPARGERYVRDRTAALQRDALRWCSNFGSRPSGSPSAGERSGAPLLPGARPDEPSARELPARQLTSAAAPPAGRTSAGASGGAGVARERQRSGRGTPPMPDCSPAIFSCRRRMPCSSASGPRRAAGHVDVDRDDLVDALGHRVRVPVRPAAVGARAERDHVLRLGHLVVEPLDRRRHLVGDRAGDHHQVGLPRPVRERDHAEPDEVVPAHAGRDELDRAAGQAEVEHPQRVAPPPVQHEPDRLAEHAGTVAHVHRSTRLRQA